MAKLALNKSSLNRESRRLKAFRQFVPALDLKRKQILAARQTSRKLIGEQESALSAIAEQVREQLPMLAESGLDLHELVQIGKVELDRVNLVGIELPVLSKVEIDRHQHSRLALPAWVDTALDLAEQRLQLELRCRVERERLMRLDAALRKTTQRLNLFDKVLIPRAENHIRRIRIALSDAERAGVVRAKIAKGKRLRAVS
ncbi:V-type ATP synthase subunit D [Marinobacterium lacunae]|uniref:V-type ATP synthase subunit D n=1 Tax=Marinobacterium lacunae TaxID=1232683 RepID=A0A081G2G4_9GAMM|nr:V-type ATP synthase subunit D [Marinobacterium lacunae]KEA64969.1 V-type ATP synthase subunit D [Marinobacterium lacunae]MBR9883576.1 V-type ATP synthase subunit D [Oceanospirillales bacterium]